MIVNPSSLAISHACAANALGFGLNGIWQGFQRQQTGLSANTLSWAQDKATYIGRVPHLESLPVAQKLAVFDCRNNRLAQLALQQDGFSEAVAEVVARVGAHRVGLFLGTSTSGMLETECAYRQRDATGSLPADFRFKEVHNPLGLIDFVSAYLHINGPYLMVSTACSSSAKVFATAYRYLQLGLCDAAVVGGVDSLCATTLYGFASLGLLSSEVCRPADVSRAGISIGEAAGFALLQRVEDAPDAKWFLRGYGESSDAYHMSTPHPEGNGAYLAMQAALSSANITPQEIDYINLHGTASRANDAAEDAAITRLFGVQTACSSTKGWTGHTLGAAGITEALISGLVLEKQYILGAITTQTVDPAFQTKLILQGYAAPVRFVLSNSFGFGGNNCSLVFAKEA